MAKAKKAAKKAVVKPMIAKKEPPEFINELSEAEHGQAWERGEEFECAADESEQADDE